MCKLGCRPGYPAVCPEGRRLQAAETQAFEQRARMMGRAPHDQDRRAAIDRLQEARRAMMEHTSEG